MSTGGMATGVSMGSSLGGPWGAAAGGALGALGLFDGGDDSQAEAYAQARRDLEAIGLPPDLSHEIVMKQFREEGRLTPELEQQLNLNYSNVAGIQEDLTGRDAQLDALNLLKQRGMGLGAEERAAFNEVRDNTQRDAEAKRMQIMQNMQARGQGGSGAELMAALSGAQASNTRLSQEGDRLGSAAAQNALSAISQSGQLGQSLRSQDYGQQMDAASSLDAMAKFNQQNSQNVQQRNIAAANAAQAANLQNQQNISNANIQMENAERLRQEQAKRDYWNDRLAQAGGMSNVSTSQGKNTTAQPNEFQQLGKALNTFGSAYKKENGTTMGQDAGNWISDKYNTWDTNNKIDNGNLGATTRYDNPVA